MPKRGWKLNKRTRKFEPGTQHKVRPNVWYEDVRDLAPSVTVVGVNAGVLRAALLAQAASYRRAAEKLEAAVEGIKEA